MYFEGLNRLIEVSQQINDNRVLFSFQFRTNTLKCLFCADERVLIIAIQNQGKGAFFYFTEMGETNGFLPYDLYYLLLNYKEKESPSIFWKALSNRVDENTNWRSPQDKEILELIGLARTNDKRVYQGDKPYFKGIQRRVIKHVSNENLDKTERYFGNDIRKFCSNNEISTTWSSEPTDKALFFTNRIEMTAYLNQELNK